MLTLAFDFEIYRVQSTEFSPSPVRSDNSENISNTCEPLPACDCPEDTQWNKEANHKKIKNNINNPRILKSILLSRFLAKKIMEDHNCIVCMFFVVLC